MSYLLDTMTLLWFLWDHPQLSGKAKRLIENPSNQKFVSLVSCWEIAIKAGLGKLNIGEPVKSFLGREISTNNFTLLPISLNHATSVETLPQHHRDPFDRLLIAQANIENLPIISSDEAFDRYGITRSWN